MLWYLVPSVVMFTCGIYGFITRKNLIAILISLELMLNSADLNFDFGDSDHNVPRLRNRRG